MEKEVRGCEYVVWGHKRLLNDYGGWYDDYYEIKPTTSGFEVKNRFDGPHTVGEYERVFYLETVDELVNFMNELETLGVSYADDPYTSIVYGCPRETVDAILKALRGVKPF